MKILAISARLPAVDKNGDQVISFFRIMHLARSNAVELICFGDRSKAEDQAAAGVLEAAGIVVHLIRWQRWSAGLQLLRALVDPAMPFQCAYFRSRRFRETVRQVCRRFAPDALYSVMIRIVPNALDYDGPLFVDMVDSMGLNFGRRASMEKGAKGWALAHESRRVGAFEKHISRRADRSYVVSRIDQQAIDAEHVGVLPLGIDTQRFNRRGPVSSEPLIAFTGNMFYQPNADAVLWFFEHCWPIIKAAVPGVRLCIVGARPQPSVIALGRQDPAVEVMGRVASVAAILNTARVAVAPMRSGSGMQFKILEAMACGVPVVATTIGLGDIGCEPGVEIVIRDQADAFAHEVVALLNSPELCEKIGSAGRRYIAAHHSWEAINQQFVEECALG